MGVCVSIAAAPAPCVGSICVCRSSQQLPPQSPHTCLMYACVSHLASRASCRIRNADRNNAGTDRLHDAQHEHPCFFATCGVALFLEKISVHRSESVCRPGNRNKRDDKWKDRSGETPDSTAKCNRLQESHWSGKRYCAKYNYLDKDKDRCLSDKALSGFRSFSIFSNEEKGAKDSNQDNPVAITVMATSSPASSEKDAPQINSTSSSAISSMSDIAS